MAKLPETEEYVEVEQEEPDTELPIDLEEEEISIGEEDEVPFTYDEDSINLVEEFEAHPKGKEILNKIVMDCYDEFKAAWESKQPYRERVAESWRIVMCDVKAKTAPFEGCANPAIPLALQNLMRLTNKMYVELFGDWSAVFNFLPNSMESLSIAPIVTQHSNWQIRNKIKGFKREQHRGLMIFAIGGDVVCHSYYDPITRSNCHEMLTCDDFVVPFSHVSTSPDFSDSPWVARRTPFSKRKIRSMGRLGWTNTDKVIKTDAPEYGEGDASTELREEVKELIGEDPFGQKRGEYEIIQWEGWLELPAQNGAEGEENVEDRYCQLIFDLGSRAPLKFTIHEAVNFHEKARHKYQMNEYEQYKAQLQALEQEKQQIAMQTEQMAQMAAEMPQGSGEVGMMAEQVHNPPQPQTPPPIKPSWMIGEDSEPEPPLKDPIYMFSHAVCIEPMLGNIGIGIGRIHTELNIATNVLWAQFLDAATLGNGGTFITAGNVDIPNPLKIGPGKINKARNVMPSDLQNAFYELKFGGGNEQLMMAAGQLMQFGEDASSTPALMGGKPGKSGETARGIQARTEQLNEMISVPTSKYADFAVNIMNNNSRLNSMFMEDHELFAVNGFDEELNSPNGVQMITAAREFYNNPFQVELVASLQFKSQAQLVSEKDEVVQLASSIKHLQFNIPFIYFALKASLEARGMHKIARTLLGPPPPPPQTPLGIPQPPQTTPDGQPPQGNGPPTQ